MDRTQMDTTAHIVWLPDDRATVVGELADVGAALHAMQRVGRLLAASTPTPTGLAGQVMVTCRLLPESARPAPRAARRRLSGRMWAAVAATLLVSLAGLVWVAYALATAVSAGLAAIAAAGGAGVVLIVALALALASGRSCTTHVTVRHHH